MQSDDPFYGQWAHGRGNADQTSPIGPVMSATSGPLNPPDFSFSSGETPTQSPNDIAPPPNQLHPAEDTRSASRSPARQQMRSASNPAEHTLNSTKSTPVLLPSRPTGSVRNIANKFNQAGVEGGQQPPQLTVRTSDERYRRNGAGKGHNSSGSRSPTKDGATRLQKRRPGQPRSPMKSPYTSFDTSSSFSSTGTAMSAKSQPHAAFSPKKQQEFASPETYMKSRPLFGEITSDGQWNGNFDLGNYGQLPTITSTNRRSSDGNLALSHNRSQSHQQLTQPQSADTLSAEHYQKLSHKRSRSDMDSLQPAAVTNSNPQQHPRYPTPPNPATRNAQYKTSPTSRIPVSNRRQSDVALPSYPRDGANSAMSNPATIRNRLSKSPTRKVPLSGKENAKPHAAGRGRYEPSPATAANGQTLSAKIVPPPPKLSPPLRSSRPRQPVNEATTSASRARAADLKSPSAPRDGRRPSEQWLGQPYNAKSERIKRNIPELGKINFEERRARIQKAISQNLEESRSQESLKTSSRSRSRQTSQEHDQQAEAGAENDAQEANGGAAGEMAEKGKEPMPGGWPTPGGLTLETFHPSTHLSDDPEPATAATEFEDESPILGRPGGEQKKEELIEEAPPVLLTAATYQPLSSSAPTPTSPVREADGGWAPSQSILDNVMRMRQASPGESDIDRAEDDIPHPGYDNPNEMEDPWGLGNGLSSVQGSIKIMLDDDPSFQPQHGYGQFNSMPNLGYDDDAAYVREFNQHAFTSNDYMDSPVDGEVGYPEAQQQDTPRKNQSRHDTLRASSFRPFAASGSSNDNDESRDTIHRVLEHYRSTGNITAEMLEQMQQHMVDLDRASINEGSNGFMIQSLLDSVLDSQEMQQMQQMQQHQGDEIQTQHLTIPVDPYEIPAVTPDTPTGWEFTEGHGTALVYSNEPSHDVTPEETEDDDFHVRIRKADEEWERQQRGEYLRLGAEENEERPEPPPKDEGYTPRSSIGPNSATFAPPDMAKGLRISTSDQLDLPDFPSPVENLEIGLPENETSSSAPPQPVYAPPAPPASESSANLPYGMAEVPQIPASYSERGSSELSPKARRNVWGASGSSRPSTDSQRPAGAPPLPGSVSMTSFTDSTRQDSIDVGGDSSKSSKTSPSPEHKRLLKRRHIVKELLDTENTYHQDLKIIEDIYKATAVPDLISPDDKKVLFGNCDDVERFSLHFFDELRKAAAPVYIPSKQMRWINKRGSYSTTQSDGASGTSMTPDGVDDEKDRESTIGQAFLQNMQRMELAYSVYLKNHEAANQRLSALRNTPTVKCWLDECHNNASDITSAWDLDSLLVKPTQRVAKYPMLLQSLVETTPADHPDREALSTAAKDMINMLTRINDAKKRAELVDQIVNRKRKESDVRSGIAKAFGRRTEKLKERVGIAEAFQDAEFDELAHKFGGHFVRLQICMRDVQNYMNQISKAVDQVKTYADVIDGFIDVSISSNPELSSKWRKYGLAVRDVIGVAFTEHSEAVNKRVIAPMVACIKLHEGPQNAINNRKKRIVDYAKCQAIEKRGEKPDKRTSEASDMYLALNDQLKLELPKLYSLTASLVQNCLACFLDIQQTWYSTWERKLRPILDAADIPDSIQQIVPAFKPEFDMVKNKILELAICNGAILADTANFLSPTVTKDDSDQSSTKRPSTLDSSKRTMSMGSENSPVPGSAAYKRRSSGYVHGMDALGFPQDARMRSNSSLDHRSTPTQTPGSSISANQPWTNTTPNSFSAGRPATAHPQSIQSAPYMPGRISAEQNRSPRPMSGATYFTARHDQPDDHRFSNIFSSAMPDDTPDPMRGASPMPAPDDMRALFVCASLFEFSIDRTRREGGYPYLTYVQGEVFDVVAQKGELWLAKNQDDSSNTLGWIWEQHFVILSTQD